MTDAVTVAYLHNNQVAYSWCASLLQLIMDDVAGPRRLLAGGMLAIRCPSAGLLPQARNRVVQHFLRQRKADWLWLVDTDMGFGPDTVERLLKAADPEHRPVVGALCFAQREFGDDGYGGQQVRPAPTIFDWCTDGSGMGGFEVRVAYERDALVRCDGTGAACLLVHRGVFERMDAAFGPTWFDRIPARDGSVGEDLSFCIRARDLQIPVHVHTGVRTTHMKTLWLGEADYLAAIEAVPIPEPVP
ncbi:MAG TPA: hypothetical protein VIV12_18935 [Streptosporangiaceae bacterium]